jgi:hypothetical protein
MTPGMPSVARSPSSSAWLAGACGSMMQKIVGIPGSRGPPGRLGGARHASSPHRCPKRQVSVAHSWPKRRLDDWLNHAERKGLRRGKHLQMRLFGGVRRRASPCPTRPVTPEVAGSSPVAPVKSLQIGRSVLSDVTAEWSRPHRLSLDATRSESIRGRPTDFKPILGRVPADYEAGADHTKRP